MSINYTPATLVAGTVLTADLWAQEVTAPMTGLQAAWTPYTPTLTGISLGSGGGAGTLTCRWRQIGKTIEVGILFAAGSSTTYTAGIAFQVTLPIAPAARYTNVGGISLGSGVIQPGAASTRVGATIYASSTGTCLFMVDNGSSNTQATSVVPGAFGTSAQLSATLEYETA